MRLLCSDIVTCSEFLGFDIRTPCFYMNAETSCRTALQITQNNEWRPIHRMENECGNVVLTTGSFLLRKKAAMMFITDVCIQLLYICLINSAFIYHTVCSTRQVAMNNVCPTFLVFNIHTHADCPLSWWRHQMKTFSALLAICVGISPVTGECPTQKPVARSFDVFFDLCRNKRLSKQSWGWYLRRHCTHYEVSVMLGRFLMKYHVRCGK